MSGPDIVIDANVFAHAENPGSPYFDDASALIDDLLSSTIRLAIDDTGKNAGNPDASNLYREYNQCLDPQGFPRAILTALFTDGRVDWHPRPAPGMWERCKKLLPKNNHDAIVMGVAVSTAAKDLVTDDYHDFTTAVRHTAKKKFGVNVEDSSVFVI